MKWLHKSLGRVFSPAPDIATVNLNDWRAIKPGGVMTLQAKDGSKWSVMHHDDFEHVLGLANLGLKPAPKDEQCSRK